jgi:SAM-dependent methyltransferase
MPRIQPFEIHTDQYESWFERHPAVYQSELSAVRQFLPVRGEGIEIGAGTGRFAAPFGIRFGIEPALNMAKKAKDRGILIVRGTGEALPIFDARFDFVLIVTTLCFLNDPSQTLSEAHRILRPGGSILLGFVDKQSTIGRIYFKNKAKSPFYRDAEFYSVEDVWNLLKKNDFNRISAVQTLFSPLEKITRVEPVESGHGEGSFVVMKAVKCG